MFKILMGNCFCDMSMMPFDNVGTTGGGGDGSHTFAAAANATGASPTSTAHDQQFVELHGILFIGLGAMVDELTPRQRVYDTLEQLRSRTERMVSIGFLVDPPSSPPSPPRNDSEQDKKEDNADNEAADIRKYTQTVSLDVWNQTYPQEEDATAAHLTRPIHKLIEQLKVSRALHSGCVCCCWVPTQLCAHSVPPSNHAFLTIVLAFFFTWLGARTHSHAYVQTIQRKEFHALINDLSDQFAAQKAHMHLGNNQYLAGITAHNLAVVRVLAGEDDDSVVELFRQASTLY
jgi:hypothetical protein